MTPPAVAEQVENRSFANLSREFHAAYIKWLRRRGFTDELAKYDRPFTGRVAASVAGARRRK